MLRKERQQPLRKGGLHESAFFVPVCGGKSQAFEEASDNRGEAIKTELLVGIVMVRRV